MLPYSVCFQESRLKRPPTLFRREPGVRIGRASPTLPEGEARRARLRSTLPGSGRRDRLRARGRGAPGKDTRRGGSLLPLALLSTSSPPARTWISCSRAPPEAPLAFSSPARWAGLRAPPRRAGGALRRLCLLHLFPTCRCRWWWRDPGLFSLSSFPVCVCLSVFPSRHGFILEDPRFILALPGDFRGFRRKVS